MSRSRSIVLSVASVVVTLLGAGCGGEGPTQPRPEVRISGDSVVNVRSAITLVAQGTDSAGAPVTVGFSWTSSDTSIASVSGSGVVTGRSTGTATITANAAFATGTHSVTVRDDRPIVPLEVGGSFTGTINSGVATERVALSVTAGDTLDLVVRMETTDTSRYGVTLEPNGAGWPKQSVGTSRGIALYGAVVAPSTGTYQLEAVGFGLCGAPNCGAPSGSYTLRVRRSAPVFSVSGFFEYAVVSVPEGGLGRDSVWTQNIGRGTVTARVTTGAAWLRPDAASVALQGPKVPGIGPAVATAIGSTLDARGLAQGVHFDSLDVDGGTGDWSAFRPAGHLVRQVAMRVTDSSARVVSAAGKLRLLAAGPDGRLYGVAGSSIVTVDSVTGATSAVANLPFYVTSFAVAADEALYVRRGDVNEGGVFRIVGTTVEPVLDLKLCSGFDPFVLLPNGTVYGLCNTILYRRTAGGAQERVATLPVDTSPSSIVNQLSIVYRAADDALYIAYGRQLWRYDQARQELAPRGPIASDIPYFRLHAVDAQGRLYGGSIDTYEVRVLDTNAAVVDRRFLADVVNNLAIAGGTIAVTGATQLWRLPVR